MDKRRLLIASNLSVSLAGIALAWHAGCQREREFQKYKNAPGEGPGAMSAPHPAPGAEPERAAKDEPAVAPTAPMPAISVQQFRAAPAEQRAAARDNLAKIIERRMNQEKPKMKLTAGQGRLASAYVTEDLPSMPRCLELAGVMPKTAIELLRSVHERGVQRKDAEEMAEYLVRMHNSLRMANPAQLDENTSRVIGRNWSEIDYSGENMTSESQMKYYRNVPDFKTLPSLRSFFRQESLMPYFRKQYHPEGSVP